MARKPLKSQLNQVRAWVRQGRTDAWIAHQLEVAQGELREFRRRHGLDSEQADDDGGDLRDEIEAEIEAAGGLEVPAPAPEDEDEDEAESQGQQRSGNGGGRGRRRRRGRGRGRGGRPGANMEAVFDHGADEGYGVWLDPAVRDDPIYAEHWRDHRPLEVTIEPDRITIRRSESE